MVKKFKSFVEQKDIEDFEEDVLGETPPNTADAMKRHKAGKAGFGDITHLKAKGLIPRSDGKKKVSDKYKQRKEMKTFKQHVKEGYKQDKYGAGNVGSATSDAVEDGSIGAHNIHDTKVMEKVNAIVGSIADKELSLIHI